MKNNEIGSSLLIVTTIMAILGFVGIFLVKNLGAELNITGYERQHLSTDEILQAALADFINCEKSLSRSGKVLPEVGDEEDEFTNRSILCACTSSQFKDKYSKYIYRYDANFIRLSSINGESLQNTRSYTYKVKIILYDNNEENNGGIEWKYHNGDLKTYPCPPPPPPSTTAASLKSLTMRLSKLGQNSLNYDGGEVINQ